MPVTKHNLTEGQKILIKSADPQGFIGATARHEPAICNQLAHFGLVKHQHGLVYRLTEDGEKTRRKLK